MLPFTQSLEPFALQDLKLEGAAGDNHENEKK
jgi:hypothetical protein